MGASAVGAATSPAPATTLEEALRAEFDEAGAAMREELAHEEEGDDLGAIVAKKAVQAHRARYLDLKREIERRSGSATSARWEGAVRNPLAPDPTWVAELSATRLDGAREASTPLEMKSTNPRWDMYRPRDATSDGSHGGGAHEATEGDAAATARPLWGMYGDSTLNGHKAAREAVPKTHRVPDASAEAAADADPPTKPFLVYRNPQGSDPEKRDVGHDR